MRQRFYCLLVLAWLMSTASVARSTGPVWLVAGSHAAASSPNGDWQLVVPSWPVPGAFAWLTLESLTKVYWKEQKWPLQRGGCYVLWRPDSKAFVVTDPEYADHYFLRLFTTEFNLEGRVLGSPIVDLSAPVQSAFNADAMRYYSPRKYDVLLFYPKALRWLHGGSLLLVGLDARTATATNAEGQVPVHEWYLGFEIDSSTRRVVQQFSDSEVRARFGIDLEKEQF